MNGQLSPLQKAAVMGGYGTEKPIEPCAVCGSHYKICVDHIVPRAQGGTNERANLQPLCEPCNLKKSGRMTDAELRAWYASNRDHIEAERERRYGHGYRD